MGQVELMLVCWNPALIALLSCADDHPERAVDFHVPNCGRPASHSVQGGGGVSTNGGSRDRRTACGIPDGDRYPYAKLFGLCPAFESNPALVCDDLHGEIESVNVGGDRDIVGVRVLSWQVAASRCFNVRQALPIRTPKCRLGDRTTADRRRTAVTVCIVRRMPRVQVYLPEDLHSELKRRGLPASELLQIALRAELERQDALSETDRYLDELMAEIGEPSEQDQSQADAVARRVRERALNRAS